MGAFYALLGFFAIFTGILAYSYLKKESLIIFILGIFGLLVATCSIGVFVGTKLGEENVLKGKPTYKMVVNYEKTDSIMTIKDTTYVLKN